MFALMKKKTAIIVHGKIAISKIAIIVNGKQSKRKIEEAREEDTCIGFQFHLGLQSQFLDRDNYTSEP